MGTDTLRIWCAWRFIAAPRYTTAAALTRPVQISSDGRTRNGRQPRGHPMPQEFTVPDIAAHRLPEAAYEANFADLHPPLDRHEAHVAADRCLFCWEAPCVAACPTGI